MNVSRKLACDRLTRTWHWMYVRLEIHRIQQNEKKAKFEERRSWNTAIRIRELRKSKKKLKKQKEERKMLKDSISTLILDFQSWGRMVAVPAINLWSLYQSTKHRCASQAWDDRIDSAGVCVCISIHHAHVLQAKDNHATVNHNLCVTRWLIAELWPQLDQSHHLATLSQESRPQIPQNINLKLRSWGHETLDCDPKFYLENTCKLWVLTVSRVLSIRALQVISCVSMRVRIVQCACLCVHVCHSLHMWLHNHVSHPYLSMIWLTDSWIVSQTRSIISPSVKSHRPKMLEHISIESKGEWVFWPF